MPPTFDPASAIGRRVMLPGQFTDPVVIEAVEDWGEVLSLRVRTLRGEPKDALVERGAFEALVSVEEPTAATWADPERVFLLVESARIRLAYAWDPFFAVSMSGIEALPHQLEAVYERMLPQTRLRYLLADDPGAGKTIMAGLLLKELRLRGAVERTLILAPAPLTLQWQDELKSKFDEVFELVDSHVARGQLGGSPWARFPQCVASIDFAKQEHIKPDLLRQRWDLVIIDEAHKAAAADLEAPTWRFRLARELVERTERLLLLTATPHQGNPQQFQNLLGLLDEHAFRSKQAMERLLAEPNSPWILRRMKEDLRDFDGRKLFVKRHAYTEDFWLNEAEYALYEAVSDYINRFLGKQSGRRKASAALARMVFQRRLASSLRAIRVSIQRRHKRLRELVEELDALPTADRERRLRELANVPTDPETDETDEGEERLDEVARDALASETWEKLVEEVAALASLEALALDTERGEETKLARLFQVLDGAEFKDLREKNGKLVIFTEHRDTLAHLRAHLEARGYGCTEIHGGMDAVARKDAQHEFRTQKQILLATDAAGEGINLQFCHLMVNYDMPWNPMRLEQRMGRIHRFGQTREVHIFNFVAVGGPQGPAAQPVVEGRVLFRLLEKLDEIRGSLGDRVFDVIGMLLRVNRIDLEDVLREASYNPRRIEDYVDEIEKISRERLEEYERATGIALARRNVDLGRIRGADWASEEKRLMPEYVEDWFLHAAEWVGLKVERRVNPALLRIEHVPQKLVSRSLAAVKHRGESDRRYAKVSFHKRELMKAENGDGVLLSPGHPLYAAVDEVLNLDLRGSRGGTARYLDPLTDRPYRLHFFEVELEGESVGDPGEPPVRRTVSARLAAVIEREDGSLEPAQPDLLHDLTPCAAGEGGSEAGPQAPTVDELRRVEGWLRARLQFPLVQAERGQRAAEVAIRRSFLEESFKASIREAERRTYELHARVMGGESDARLARDEAQRRVDELKASRDHRLRGLDHLAVVRPGNVARLVSAVILPPPASVLPGMRRDDEVEAFAMAFATRYEEGRGWKVKDISKDLDGSGFDLRSTSPENDQGVREVRRIEVKGRAGHDREVHLTPNEWRQAQRLRGSYWLYVVWGCKTTEPVLKAIQDPWATLGGAAEEIRIVKAVRLPGEALVGAEGELWKA
ncbi:MAG: helicase-related protein [Pseudomonadota bacterium]